MRVGLTCLWLLSVVGLPTNVWAHLPHGLEQDILGSERMTPALIQQLRRYRVQHGTLPPKMPLLIGWRSTAPDHDERLGAQGISLATARDIRSRSLHSWSSATVTPAGLAVLASHPEVRVIARATSGWVRATLPTTQELDRGLHLSGIDLAQLRRDATGQRTTGRGSVICNVDDGVDVFHPMLFHADGGLYVWFDEDGDGRVTPGIDRIDMDRDGSPDGILSLLDSGTVEAGGGEVEGLDGAFTAGRDYLFIDEDGDGVRDVGPPKYDDATPAFGEPLFIADDVDGDGVLERDERLTRLNSSKIAGIYRVGGASFVRGLNVTSAGYESGGSHGTSVSSLLVGGVLGRTSVVGVAPQADVIVIDRYWDPEADDASLLNAMLWAADLGAQIFVHPYGSHFAEFSDGSSPWEAVLDEFSAGGRPQIVGTHNFAGNDGHAASTVSNAQPQLFELKTFHADDAGFALLGTFRWRDAPLDALEVTLFTPDGAEIPLTPGESEYGLWYASVTRSQSSRGTSMVSLLLMLRATTDGEFTELCDNDFLVELATTHPEEVSWQLQVSDESGYAVLTSVVGLATNAGTIASPATADTAISVGASRGAPANAEMTSRELQPYSGQGPRIDGYRGIDLVAPAGLYAASRSGDGAEGAPHLGRFEGTSASAPLVAGVAALIQSALPDLSADQIAARLFEGATADAWTGSVPNNSWGFGHLSAYRALFDQDPPDNRPPQARVSPVVSPSQGQAATLDATPTTDPDDSNDRLLFRWDLDYDGQWDSEMVGEPITDVRFEEPGRYVVKLEVEDPLGFSDQLLVPIEVLPASYGEAREEPESLNEGSPRPGSTECSGGDGTLPLQLILAAAVWWFTGRRRRAT